MKALHSVETLRNIYSSTRGNNPEDLVSQYESRFAPNKILQCSVISSG